MPATFPVGGSTSSRLIAAQFAAVWLYRPVGDTVDVRGGPSIGAVPPGTPAAQPTQRFSRVARVLLSVPIPALVEYPPNSRNFYVWSKHDGAFVLTVPYEAVLAADSVPAASPLADPATF